MEEVVKLGRLEKRVDPRTKLFAKYVNLSSLPAPPETVDWTSGVSAWQMLGNSQWGDCTIAGAAHQIMIWSSQVHGTPNVIPEQSVVDTYLKLSGGQDTGLVELDVLNSWRKDGLLGHTVKAFAEVNVADQNHIAVATWLFGGLYIGLNLPNSAKNQEVWDAVSDFGGDWGGHCVVIAGIDKAGLTCVTWGATKRMTWAFFLARCDEAWAIIPDEYSQLPLGGIKGVGFDLDHLIADIDQVGSAK